MAETFTWKVTAESSGAGNFVVNQAKFGDNYSQRSKAGLNNSRETWTVIAVGYEAEVQAIVDFVKDRGGAEAFNWTPPLGVQGLYVCNSWNPRKLGGDFYEVTMEFEQVGVSP